MRDLKYYEFINECDKELELLNNINEAKLTDEKKLLNKLWTSLITAAKADRKRGNSKKDLGIIKVSDGQYGILGKEGGQTYLLTVGYGGKLRIYKPKGGLLDAIDYNELGFADVTEYTEEGGYMTELTGFEIPEDKEMFAQKIQEII